MGLTSVAVLLLVVFISAAHRLAPSYLAMWALGRGGKCGCEAGNVPCQRYPLLTKNDARRLPSDEIIIVVNGDMPIRVKRLQYYADTKLEAFYEGQNFKAPLPMPSHTITDG